MNQSRQYFESVKKLVQKLSSQRRPVVIDENDVLEQFMKGSGPGGQAVNKTNNAVLLVHKPTGIQVRSHLTRYLEVNRKDARKRLITELDKAINGDSSKESIEALKQKERKRQSARKSKKKHSNEPIEAASYQLFTMKLASKQMSRNAKKCEKEEGLQKTQVKKAIEKNNPEMARIYATNAIRKKNEALNYMRMSARFDMVASQIQSAVTSGMVSKTMNDVVKGLEKAVENDNVEKISMMMDQFETQCSQLNTQTSYMEGAMSTTGQLTTPIDQVDELIQQVGDSYGLDVKMALRDSSQVPNNPVETSAAEQNDELTHRLNALRGNL